MKIGRSMVFVLALLMLPCGVSYAIVFDCSTESVQLIPDGRGVTDAIAGLSTNVYAFETFPGHSYSVEVAPVGHKVGTFNVTILVLDAAIDTCPGGPTSLTLNNTQDNDPALHDTSGSTTNGFRRSFTVPGTGTSKKYLVVTNGTAGEFAYTVSVSETTLFSPRWTTFGGYHTSWGFFNTTRNAVNVTITARDGAGTELASDTFSLTGEQGGLFKSTTSLGISANRSGVLFITHDGPPDAILVDGYMVSATGQTGFYAKVLPMREASPR